MMKKIVFLGLFLPQCLGAQPVEPGLIPWSEHRKLEWSDYRYRKPISTYTASAMSEVRILATPRAVHRLPDIEFFIYFDKHRSWTTDSLSQELLEHEQYHFDIYELYARKIRAGIIELRKQGETEEAIYFESINALIDECEQVQTAYDRETAHGFIKQAQSEWQAHVNAQLQTLKEFSTDEYLKSEKVNLVEN